MEVKFINVKFVMIGSVTTSCGSLGEENSAPGPFKLASGSSLYRKLFLHKTTLRFVLSYLIPMNFGQFLFDG